jgi:hypothetical protein
LWIVIVRVSVFTIGLAGSVLAATSGWWIRMSYPATPEISAPVTPPPIAIADRLFMTVLFAVPGDATTARLSGW